MGVPEIRMFLRCRFPSWTHLEDKENINENKTQKAPQKKKMFVRKKAWPDRFAAGKTFLHATISHLYRLSVFPRQQLLPSHRILIFHQIPTRSWQEYSRQNIYFYPPDIAWLKTTRSHVIDWLIDRSIDPFDALRPRSQLIKALANSMVHLYHLVGDGPSVPRILTATAWPCRTCS